MSDQSAGADGVESAFAASLRRLTDAAEPPTPGLLNYLSDPRASDVELFRGVWPNVPVERRRWLARRLLEAAEASVHVFYNRLFTAFLDDADAEVRALGIDGLWEAEDARLAQRFASLLRHDPEPAVRARAAVGLGTYVELGQLERIGADVARMALLALADAAGDESEEPEVRRRATESAGYGDYKDTGNLIEAAIDSHVPAMRAAALRAMGNSADDRWEPEVLARLDDRLPEIRFEAAHAAGELSLVAAVPALVALLDDADREVSGEAVWSLGEIGGEAAGAALHDLLAEADDPELEQAIEDALAAMTLSDGELPWSDLFERAPGAYDGPGHTYDAENDENDEDDEDDEDDGLEVCF